jgi:hypothetical protein
MLQLLMEALAAGRGRATAPFLDAADRGGGREQHSEGWGLLCASRSTAATRCVTPICFFRCYCQLVSVCRCCCSMWHVYDENFIENAVTEVRYPTRIFIVSASWCLSVVVEFHVACDGPRRR